MGSVGDDVLDMLVWCGWVDGRNDLNVVSFLNAGFLNGLKAVRDE